MRIAAQLWIFSQTQNWDAQAVGLLRSMAEAGYESVEGLYGKAPYKGESLRDAGIAYGAAHLTPPGLKTLEPLLDFLHAMDARHVCSSGPLQWHERTGDDYRKTAEFLNETGRRLREREIRLHYHNHEFEFEKVDGERTAMDLLLTVLDPDCVTLCFDAGWAERAGQNAADFLREHGDRVEFLHLRDFRGAQSVPLGQGDLNLAAQIALLPSLPNLKYLVVEQDPSENPPEDMRISRRYLRDTFGL